jgi:hypothetical protein
MGRRNATYEAPVETPLHCEVARGGHGRPRRTTAVRPEQYQSSVRDTRADRLLADPPFGGIATTAGVTFVRRTTWKSGGVEHSALTAQR